MIMAAFRPPGPPPLLPVAALVGFGLGVLLFPPTPARSDEDLTITGYRLEMRVCQGETCRLLGVSRTPWRKRAACQERITLIVEGIKAGTIRPPFHPAGNWQVQSRCAPVLELRSA